MLIKAVQVCKPLKEDKKLLDLIESTLENFITNIRNPKEPDESLKPVTKTEAE
jgi:hypothetical protein